MDSASLAPLIRVWCNLQRPNIGTSDPGFEVLSSPNGPHSFSFNRLTGGPGLLKQMLGPFKGLPAD